MTYRKLFLLFLLPFQLVVAQQTTLDRPRLVVGISIDDLRQDYLSLFWHELSEGGFKKIVQEGAVCKRASFSYNVAGDAVDITTLSTGALPYLHGISGDNYFDRKQEKYYSVVRDKSVSPVGGSRAVSAKRVLATTFADELYESSLAQSKVVSIALQAQESVLQVGHVAKWALWMDNIRGGWSSSSYYTNYLPMWLQAYNDSSSVKKYLEKDWEPLFPPGYYVAAATKKPRGFSYNIKRVCDGPKFYDNFSTTPFANSYLNDLALEVLKQEELGKDLHPDLLLINYSLESFFKVEESGLCVEQEDAYLRLDLELQRLLKAVEVSVGTDNVLFYLTSPRNSEHPRKAIHSNLPGSSFRIDRYTALLNSYLMAFFGQHQFVLGSQNGHIYLNRAVAEEYDVDFKALQEKAVEFFASIPGVQDICTSYELERLFVAGNKLSFAYNKSCSGDLFFSLMPGWYEVDAMNQTTGYFSLSSRTVPLYFYGWRVEPQSLDVPIDLTDVAFSLSRWVQVSTPNACQGVEIPLKLKVSALKRNVKK